MSDYIKREDAVKTIRLIKTAFKAFEKSIDDAADTLNDLANSADVGERKKGKWLYDPEGRMRTDDILADCGYEHHEWICSECREEPWWCGVDEEILPPFCPHCGADMRGEE